MIEILNLALPFFGLIFIGFLCGKLKKLPDEGLAWMNFYILYVSLPALFFRILSKTPFEQLAQLDFIKATTLATAGAFTIALTIGLVLRRGKLGEATLAGVAGGFGNVGYMGPALALATLGQAAAVPVALIFCFDALLIFTLVPLLMAFSGTNGNGIGRALLEVAKGILLNPLLISAALGVLAAAYQVEPPVALERLLQFLFTSAAPCALFALGVTLALRPFEGIPPEVPWLVGVKLIVHPLLVLLLLPVFGTFGRAMDQHRRADGGSAAGTVRLCIRAPARNLGPAGVEHGTAGHAGFGGHPDWRDVAGADAFVAATTHAISRGRSTN